MHIWFVAYLLSAATQQLFGTEVDALSSLSVLSCFISTCDAWVCTVMLNTLFCNLFSVQTFSKIQGQADSHIKLMYSSLETCGHRQNTQRVNV